MKYLRHYKIFEDIDEDDTVPDGFKYSWNDIYESLFYLTDIMESMDIKRSLENLKNQI